MACRYEYMSSSNFENYQGNEVNIAHENQKSSLLFKEGEEFFWTGDLKDLKQFVGTCLQLQGKWSSPGGDTKQFASDEFVIKWYGATKKKLVLVKDSKENPLKFVLQNLARDLSGKDKDIVGDIALDEILFTGSTAESSEIDSNGMRRPMPLGIIKIGSKDDSEVNLEVKFQSKYRELEQELCKLREVINNEILLSRDFEKGLAEDVFTLKKSINNRESIYQVSEEIALLRTENTRLKDQENNLMNIISGLNKKLEIVEEEKKNLIMAVQILQGKEDDVDTNMCNVGETIIDNKSHTPPLKLPGIPTQSNNDVLTANRFSILADEMSQSSFQHSPQIICDGKVSEIPQAQIEKAQSYVMRSARLQSQTERNQSITYGEVSTSTGYESVIFQDDATEKSQNTTGKRNFGSNNKTDQKNPAKSNSNEEAQGANQRRSSKPIVIIGDSEHINPRKLSRRPVKKFTYPGKTCEEITEFVDNIIVNDDPSHVIIHCGTNNLMTDPAEVCVDKLKNLVSKVKTKFPNCNIGLSSITYRGDINVDPVRIEVNEHLKRLAIHSNFLFIDNSVIDSSCVNNSKLHLNDKGTALLAVQFIKFLRSSTSNGQFFKGSNSGFRTSLIIKLGETMMSILEQTRSRH